jgi:DNA polymerase-3 subunit delta'
MSEASPLARLGTALCPWLSRDLDKLEQAHAGERLGHAWLLTGTRGVGKINLALVLASRLLSRTVSGSPPPALDAATAADAMRARHEPSDHHPDLHWVHPLEDKVTISVEQIREVSQDLSLKGFAGGAKVVIVEPAEAMTVAAANALLKTLEEPTASTYLLLVSHQPGRLVGTIRSRCQTLLVRGPAAEEGRAWLGALGHEGLGPDAYRAPLHVAEMSQVYVDNSINEIPTVINSIYEIKGDPHAWAEKWAKLDLGLVLEALAVLIQRVIRARAAGEASNSITDRGGDSLHNAWPALTLKELFRQLDAAQRLRESLGTGINAELALRVLLSGFQPDRGAS